MPTEPAVIHALSAVLGVDERSLFEKAGQEPPPDQETSPTLEEALASLTPMSDEADESDVQTRGEAMSVEQRSDEVDLTEDELAAPRVTEDEPASADLTEEPLPLEEVEPQPESEPEASSAPAIPIGRTDDPGYVKPPEPYLLMPTTPRFVEPSYVEDAGQRQLYRVRNLATVVVVVAMVIALIWALSESLGALGQWWDQFFGSLRL